MENKDLPSIYSNTENAEKIKKNFEYQYDKLSLQFPELKDEKEKDRLRQKLKTGCFDIFLLCLLSLILTYCIVDLCYGYVVSLLKIDATADPIIALCLFVFCFITLAVLGKKWKTSNLIKPLCQCGYPLQKIEICKNLSNSWEEHEERKEKEYSGYDKKRKMSKYHIKYYDDVYKVEEYTYTYECPHCKEQKHKTSTSKRKISSKLISVVNE